MSSINRSTYQKVVEENKRLLADIQVLSNPNHTLYKEVSTKWQNRFKKDKEFTLMLRKALGIEDK